MEKAHIEVEFAAMKEVAKFRTVHALGIKFVGAERDLVDEAEAGAAQGEIRLLLEDGGRAIRAAEPDAEGVTLCRQPVHGDARREPGAGIVVLFD